MTFKLNNYFPYHLNQSRKNKRNDAMFLRESEFKDIIKTSN
jgi:hypothetical protein